MKKSREIETNNGLQGELIVKNYDDIMKESRDKGHLYTDEIIKFRITNGKALEIGPGPGYLGLEWLNKTNGTTLIGLDISSDMIRIAEKNAADYGFSNDRVRYSVNDAKKLPFDDNTFDAVFTNASLHEWEEVVTSLNEIHRVLKPDGRYFISDLRRDMNFLVKFLMKMQTKKQEMRLGLIASINASYTEEEIKNILQKTKLTEFEITKNPFSLFIKGIKK
jgi:ubiquinone/menaquinone biosynthesis C-methylase UbiE